MALWRRSRPICPRRRPNEERRINETKWEVVKNTKVSSRHHGGTSHRSCFALLLFPLCRRSKRRRCDCIAPAFPGAAIRCSCCCGSQGRFLYCTGTCYSRDRRQVDQSFPARFGSIAGVPYGRTRLDWFRRSELAPLRFARPFGKCRSIMREHFCYLMLGLLWTVAYWLVDQLTPGAFA